MGEAVAAPAAPNAGPTKSKASIIWVVPEPRLLTPASFLPTNRWPLEEGLMHSFTVAPLLIVGGLVLLIGI